MTRPVALASGLASLLSIAAGAAALLWRRHGHVQLLRLHLGEQLKVVDASSSELGSPFIGRNLVWERGSLVRFSGKERR